MCLEMLECCVIVGVSWCDFGVVIIVFDLDVVVELFDRIVFEYLEFCVVDLDVLSEKIIYVGVIFFG